MLFLPWPGGRTHSWAPARVGFCDSHLTTLSGLLWPELVPAELGPWLPLILCPEALQPSFIMAWRCFSVTILVTLWAGQFFVAWDSLDMVGHFIIVFPTCCVLVVFSSGCEDHP